MHDLKPLEMADLLLMAACCACLDLVILTVALTLGAPAAFIALVLMTWRWGLFALGASLSASLVLSTKGMRIQPSALVLLAALALGGVLGVVLYPFVQGGTAMAAMCAATYATFALAIAAS